MYVCMYVVVVIMKSIMKLYSLLYGVLKSVLIYIYYVIFTPLRGNYVTPRCTTLKRISDYSHAFKSSVL